MNTWHARLAPIYPPPAITHPGMQVICSAGCTGSHMTDAATAFAVKDAPPGTYCCFLGVGDSHWATTQLTVAIRDYQRARDLT